MLNRGLFITFEGTDGVGKSTQIEKTYRYLKNEGYDVVLTREPGGTRISELIRMIVLDERNTEMFYETEALLYAAARAQHVKELVEPSLAAGKMVISDRYIDSSLAYQGHARGLGIRCILDINRFAIGKTMPDITFYLDIPAELAVSRKKMCGGLDRIEQDGPEFMSKAEEGYRILLEEYKDRIVCVDATGAAEEVFDRIKAELIKKIIY
jgi:dTMP kinase